MEDQRVEAQDFSDLKEGDEVTRLLAGVVPMTMVVESVDDTLIHMKGGWTFDRKTGFEEDEELGFGVKFGYTGSFLTR